MNISRGWNRAVRWSFTILRAVIRSLEQFDRAALTLETALRLGYRDFRWLARDPDLCKLRQQPIYRDIEAKIRRMKVKVG